MISSFFRVLFLAALGLVIAWATFLSLPAMSQQTLRCDEAWYCESYSCRFPSMDGSKDLELPPMLWSVLPESREALHAAGVLISRRLVVSRNLVPFWIVFLAISTVGGALLRERLHLGTAYASPTVSFLSKRVGEAALLVYFLWSFAPIPLPYWVFYPALFSAMVAALGYIANLPLKL